MSSPAAPPDFDPVSSLLAGLGLSAAELYGCRQERKLVVAPATAAALRDAVAVALPREEWSPGRARTLIHTVYLDTPDFALYQRCMARGPAPSLKLRVRAYGGAATPDRPDAAQFFEAKLGVTTPAGERIKQKARFALTPEQLSALFCGRLDPTEKALRKPWQGLFAYVAAFEVRPRLTVSYVREAFVDPAAGLRITFDRDYRATALDGAATPLSRAAVSLGDAVIVEIKLVDALPGWLAEALAAHELPLDGQRFSKYKTAVPLLFPHVSQRTDA